MATVKGGQKKNERLTAQAAGVLSHQQANQPITSGRILVRIRASILLLRRHTQTRLPSLSNTDVLMLFLNTVFDPGTGESTYYQISIY